MLLLMHTAARSQKHMKNKHFCSACAYTCACSCIVRVLTNECSCLFFSCGHSHYHYTYVSAYAYVVFTSVQERRIFYIFLQ